MRTKYLKDIKNLAHWLTPASSLGMFDGIKHQGWGCRWRRGGVKEDSQKWHLLPSNLAETGLE